MDNFLDALVQVAATALSAMLIVLLRYGISYLKAKTQSTKIRTALDELEKVIADGVAFTEQTLVSSFKENDSWTKEAQHECLLECVKYVTSNLTEETTSLLLANESDIDSWVTAKIEAYIQKSKTN